MNLKFKPHSDECTAFEKVRILRFREKSIDVTIACEGEARVFENMKPFALYYDTETSKIMNVLQEVKFTSEKLKAKYRLEELVELSDIERVLKDWNNRSLEVLV